jgi:hypothetical protein
MCGMRTCSVVCANLCKVTQTQLILEYLAEFDAESAHVIPIFPSWQQKKSGANIHEQDNESRWVDHGEEQLPFH